MYLKVRTDPYATREVAAPRSFREPEWKEDLRIAETDDYRDELGPQVIPSNSALPMRQPWLADLGSQVNTALSYGPGSKGFAKDQKPKEVHGVVRASGSGITPTTDISALLNNAVGNLPAEKQLYDELNAEIGIIQSQTGGDAAAGQIQQAFATQWASATQSPDTDYERMQTLTAMADYVTQYFQFYQGSLVGPDVSKTSKKGQHFNINDPYWTSPSKTTTWGGYPTGKGFTSNPVLGDIWTDLEMVRINGGTDEATHYEQLALMNITQLVESLANDGGDTQQVMGLPLTLPDVGLSWSATELVNYLNTIIEWDKANGTTYATEIAQLMFDNYNGQYGFKGSIAATDSSGKSMDVYGNLFNISNSAVFAAQGSLRKGATPESGPWDLQSTQPVTFIQSMSSDGQPVTQTADFSSLQFRVQVANAMSEIVMVYWQLTYGWTPTIKDSYALQETGGNQIIIVTKPDTQPISNLTPAWSPSAVSPAPLSPSKPGPTPTWEYVALAAGGGLLAYLIWRQV